MSDLGNTANGSEYVRVVTHDEPVPLPPATPALHNGYEPDRFQKFAIEAIEQSHNVLITAKTGSGKTFVGEYQIAKTLQRGGRTFYTTPVKSLSNQKFNDLKKLFPNNSVGIMTGDIKFRPDAEIIVMTTEILRNLLFKQGTLTEKVGVTALLSLDGLDSVVFDEVHYINDEDRGHVWEECLILLPPAVKLILLSATLSSPFGFAKWLGESKKVPVWLISTLWRAVPLEHCVIGIDGSNRKFYDSKESFHEDTYRGWLAERSGTLVAHDKFKDKVKAAKASGHEGPVGGKVRPKSFEHELNGCLGQLHESGGLPAIVFVFSRVGCEKLAKKVQHNFIDSSDAAAVSHIWDFHLSRYKDCLEFSPQAHALKALAMRGIAYHHSGLLPFLKEILEILFARGLCKVLFATETFAVGINMPTKTVIFTALDKFTDGGERLLKTSEYIQMAGRAGRRGKDDRGLVIYLPQRDPVSVSELKQIVCGKVATFGSRMNFGYDFLLKILNASSPSSSITERELIQKSYWNALEQDYLNGLVDQAAALAAELPRVNPKPEEQEECETYHDIQRRISENQNAKKKAAQRELVNWKDGHKESIWNPILVRYEKWLDMCKKKAKLDEEIDMMKDRFSNGCNIPIVQARRLLLEECGFVSSCILTPLGRLCSEINEGHPFLMTELYEHQANTLSPLSATDLLTVLALFIGDKGKPSTGMPKEVNEVLDHLNRHVKKLIAMEERYRIHDPKLWELSTDWLDPVADWLEGEISVAELAAKYELFEGNVQKALLKLGALLEEFQAMATISGNVKILKLLDDARPLVLRDLILAESLYLRI
jgi:superfamily II RNA helicase